jgi:hypothetical protein
MLFGLGTTSSSSGFSSKQEAEPTKNAPLNQHVGACPVIPESVACKLRHRLCQLSPSSSRAKACMNRSLIFTHRTIAAILPRSSAERRSHNYRFPPALEHICCAAPGQGPWFQWDSNRGPSAGEKTARARLPCNQPGRANKAVIRGGEGRRSVQSIFKVHVATGCVVQ